MKRLVLIPFCLILNSACHPTNFPPAQLKLHAVQGGTELTSAAFPPNGVPDAFFVTDVPGARNIRLAGRSPDHAEWGQLFFSFDRNAGVPVPGHLQSMVPDSSLEELFDQIFSDDNDRLSRTFLAVIRTPSPSQAPEIYCARFTNKDPATGALNFEVDLALDRSVVPGGAVLPPNVTPYFCEAAYFDARMLYPAGTF